MASLLLKQQQHCWSHYQQNADVVISNKKNTVTRQQNGNDNGTSNGDDPNGEGALEELVRGVMALLEGLTGRKQ